MNLQTNHNAIMLQYLYSGIPLAVIRGGNWVGSGLYGSTQPD